MTANNLQQILAGARSRARDLLESLVKDGLVEVVDQTTDGPLYASVAAMAREAEIDD